MSFPFLKLVGAGNDFIFLSGDDLPKNKSRSQWAQTLCQKNFGVGADGLVIIEDWQNEGQRPEFRWDFYNSDGSKANMCGNAARCATLYSQIRSPQSDTCRFQTALGWLEGQVSELGFSVSWGWAKPDPEQKTLTIENGKRVTGYFVNSGVPHFVIVDGEASNLSGRDCLLIQAHEIFGEEQTNVTLLTETAQDIANTKSFERGVRNFTLACGTGVIASALVLQKIKGGHRHRLQAPGGLLGVELFEDKVIHQGPAICSFRGTFQY
ncbi:MAG: diaminopimelate epimerase [Bdellovibrionales bacterium]|nr:diaminopimelate epimerase [Bdellovibrionales bacterium]